MLQNNFSFQEAVSLFTNITELYKNIDTEDVHNQTRRKPIFRMSVSFQRLLLNYGSHHLSESTPQKKILSNSLGEKNKSRLEKWVTLRKVGHTQKNGSHLEKWVTLRKMVHI